MYVFMDPAGCGYPGFRKESLQQHANRIEAKFSVK